MASTSTVVRSPARVPAYPLARRGSWQVVAVALAAGLVRLPFLGRPLGPDEGGLLMVAGQWRPGTSLYGDYWVDRPPVLIDAFAVAARLGGLLPLRLIGTVLVVASVLLAGRIGRLVGASDAAATAAAVTAGLLLAHPLLGVLEVNGELVATPAVLAATCAALTAARAEPGARRSWWTAAAGGLGALAVMVKQNEVDALVLLVVGTLTFAASGWRRRSTALLLAGGGALGVTGLVVLHAAALGTGPGALGDAVVTFRLEASRVIGAHAPPGSTGRGPRLLLDLLASGAPLLLLAASRHLPLRPRAAVLDVRWATLALLAWETVSVVAGGSYWRHYLICLVPGLVLVAALLAAADPVRHATAPRSLRRALVAVATSAALTLGAYAVVPGLDRPDPVVTWLRAHTVPGETGVVVLGHPEYLAASGLRSPYPELWSLPVRVRDPQLRELTAVLDGPDRPDWVVTGGRGRIGGWGIAGPHAQVVFDSHYRLVADLGDRLVFHARTAGR